MSQENLWNNPWITEECLDIIYKRRSTKIDDFRVGNIEWYVKSYQIHVAKQNDVSLVGNASIYKLASFSPSLEMFLAIFIHR